MSNSHDSMLPREIPVQLIAPDGSYTADSEYVLPDSERLKKAYRSLIMGRRLNDQCNALVRQGRMAVYPSSNGQEACQVAAANVLGADDWLFPTYRETVAIVEKGVKPEEALVLLQGGWHAGYDPNKYKVAPQATPLATQLLHASGFAQAAKYRGEGAVVLATTGDGATSEGDFHEAMNFAAVFKLPVVFFIQNNEFAISVPLSKQTAARSLAYKAIGYGMPGERVDGNDMAALLAVLDKAVARARAGEGPTLIEAHTYRMLAHTNADDDTKYREREEVQEWVKKDPLTRLQTYLTSAGILDQATDEAFIADAEKMASDLRDALNSEPELDPEDMFNHVYANRPAMLDKQWDMLRDELAREEA